MTTRVALIGLDTSHSIEFSKLMNASDCPAELHVDGLQAVSCMRFATPFQSEENIDKRQAQLEGWGVKVTRDFDEAVADCDAIMVEINDPAYHLEYFKKVAALGKPVFLDKPLAGSVEDGREILSIMRSCGTRVWSGSSLPFAPAISEACAAVPEGKQVVVGHCFGPYGVAPAGDSLIWYGVHTFEMLRKLMGFGAKRVMAQDNGLSVVVSVEYEGGRRGLAELVRGQWSYGGRVQWSGGVCPFVVDGSRLYHDLLVQIGGFLAGGPAPVSMEDTFEGLAMMVAASESLKCGGALVDVATL